MAILSLVRFYYMLFYETLCWSWKHIAWCREQCLVPLHPQTLAGNSRVCVWVTHMNHGAEFSCTGTLTFGVSDVYVALVLWQEGNIQVKLKCLPWGIRRLWGTPKILSLYFMGHFFQQCLIFGVHSRSCALHAACCSVLISDCTFIYIFSTGSSVILFFF